MNLGFYLSGAAATALQSLNIGGSEHRQAAPVKSAKYFASLTNIRERLSPFRGGNCYESNDIENLCAVGNGFVSDTGDVT
jgi:hypothetical protein